VNEFIEHGPARKRDLQKQATRARILHVARSHFERDGFDGANIRAIAADVGVAAGTVLLHFTDKRDLLHAALFVDLSEVIDEALAASGRGALQPRLHAIARAFFAYYAARPTLSKALLREALLADSPWRERFTAQVARVHAHVTQLADDAKARGELAAVVKTPVLAASFFSFYYFALIAWVQGGLANPAPMFEVMLSEHLRGLDGAKRSSTTRRKKKR